MKKILSTLLVAAMLLSLVVVIAAVPAAADDSFWTVYGSAAQNDPDFDGDPKSVPGYEYTKDGFHMTTADWSTSTPWAHIQTTEAVSLKDGVYMQVRVDSYNYDASDKWFNVNIWNQPMFEAGSAEEKYGHGVQTLIRPGSSTDAAVPGAISGAAWYIEEFTSVGSSNFDDAGKAPVDGKNVITLIVSWDAANSTYVVSINGAAAPDKVITYMNETFGADDSAYIGFAMHSDKKGGSMEATVINYGTDADSATTPAGTASKDPENFNIEYAAIADPSTVPAGQPAIIMTGNKAESALKGTPNSGTGAKISITSDYLVHVVSTKSTTDIGVWRVDNNVSYDIKDFPVAICLTKNLCTCGFDGECMAFESAGAYMLNGDDLAAAPGNKVSGVDMCYDPYVIGDDSYLYFYVDMAAKKPGIEGRINGLRIDFSDIDVATPGANAFDIEMIAYFRTVEEAEAYVEAYLTAKGWTPDGGDIGGDDNNDDVNNNDQTNAGNDNVDETEAPTEATTEAPVNNNENNNNNNNNNDTTTSEGGCGSVVGFGAIAVVAVASVAGIVTFKKKED